MGEDNHFQMLNINTGQKNKNKQQTSRNLILSNPSHKKYWKWLE